MKETPYGLLAAFDEPQPLVKAAQEAYDAGFRKLDAFTPFPVEGLHEAIGFHHTRMSLVVLIGGITGASFGFLLQVWAMDWSYKINVGNRPLISWPAYIPVTFEMTILFAALFGAFGMLAANKLPMLYHPIFNVPEFERASQNRFFLCIESADALFDQEKTRAFLRARGAKDIYDVAR